MKSLILKKDGYEKNPPENFELKDLSPWLDYGDLPEPEPEKGEVKIKVTLASVNPSDEMFIQGMYGQPRVKGNGAGFEGMGEVVASGGGGYADSMVGQRVAFFGKAGRPGTWSEFSIADAMTCIPLRKDVSDEDGAALIVNPLTAVAMFGIVKEMDSKAFILSAAASQLCKLIMNVARDEGYEPIAIVRRDSQFDLMREAGAKHVLNSESETFEEDLKKISRETKPRVFLDAVANNSSAAIFDAMPNKARWVIYGKLDEELPTIKTPGQLIFQSKQIEGFWLTRWQMERSPEERIEAVQNVQARFASGAWKTDVTAIVPLSKAMEQLPTELAKPNGKVFIKPD